MIATESNRPLDKQKKIIDHKKSLTTKKEYMMNKLRLQSESGFTLIELLVVVAIIGILAAIAIPQFAAYRKRGHEAQVKSDLRNAAVSEEAYFAANSTYKASSSAWVGGASPT